MDIANAEPLRGYGTVAEGAGYSGDLHDLNLVITHDNVPSSCHIKIPDKCNKLANMGNSKQDYASDNTRGRSTKILSRTTHEFRKIAMRDIHQITTQGITPKNHRHYRQNAD